MSKGNTVKVLEVIAPQLEWVAKQYPNKGTWLSACGEYLIFVNDQGTFDVYLETIRLDCPVPWRISDPFKTFAEAIKHCEVYDAQISSVQTKEEA